MITQRKRPTIRIGPKLAGLPPDEPAPTAISPTMVSADPRSPAQIVSDVMEAVDQVDDDPRNRASTDRKILDAVSAAFAPQLPAANPKSSPPKKRGRPVKYASDEERRAADTLRKRKARARAKSTLVGLLRCFKLKVDSLIPPGLRSKYDIEVTTYRELLENENVQAKVFKEIVRELKMIGAINNPPSTRMSAGRFMTEAPQGRGELVVTDNVETIDGVRTAEHRSLSKPEEFSEESNYGPDIPTSSLDPEKLNITVAGDRRRKRPGGQGPRDDEEGGTIRGQLYPTG
jgi:hypothetical protein